jgi:hypothetical protein
VVETSKAEIIVHIAGFAANVNIPEGEELLLHVADERIKRYADWTVKHEFYDIIILKLLESKIPLSSQDPGATTPTSLRKTAIAQRFAQLYSYAIQRYIKGKDILNETQLQQLASVLIEIEDKSISRLMGGTQATTRTIRRAIERGDTMEALLDEHNKLLGNETTAGQLPSKLGFDYSTTPNGPKRTAPIPLPEKPQKTVTNN